MRNEWYRKNAISLLLLAVGLLSAFFLLCQRISFEQKNHHLSVVISYPDAQILAETSGLSAGDCLSRLASAGLSAVILPGSGGEFDAAAVQTIQNAGLGLILSPEDAMSLEDYLAARQKLKAEYPLYLSLGGKVEDLARSGLPVGLVEDNRQYTYEPISGFDAMAEVCPMVRVFRLLPEYQVRYGVFGYEGAEEIENIFYRAAADRGIRVLWLTPFLHPDTEAVIGDLSEYTGLLSHLSQRLRSHGLVFDGAVFPIGDRSPPPILLFFCCLGVAAGAVILLETILPASRRVILLLLIAGAAASAAGIFWEPRLTAKFFAFGACVIFPCLAAYRLIAWINGRPSPIRENPGNAATRSAIALLCGLGITLAGCLFIGAILSDSKYLLSIDTFTGVKASQTLPLFYALLLSVYLFLHRSGMPFSGWEDLKFRLKNRRTLVYILLFLIILAGAGAFFIFGTGDSGLLRGGLMERRFRNFLEAAVLVRPRLKEFLLAWPSLVLAFFLYGKGNGRWAWLFLLPPAAGFASVANTFCHIRAPVLTSLARTLYGALFGYLIGLFCVLLIRLLFLRGTKEKETGSDD